MYIECTHLFLIIFICLFIGFEVGSFLEKKYWEAYIELNKDSTIDALRYIIERRNMEINNLNAENRYLRKYKKMYELVNEEGNCHD